MRQRRLRRSHCWRSLVVGGVCLLAASFASPAAADDEGLCGRGSCFEPWMGYGCNDQRCCDAVCAIDPFCCKLAWDHICVTEAFALCVGCEPPDCRGVQLESEPFGKQLNGGCLDPEGYISSCCFNHATSGCDDAGCQADVCAVDPACCSVSWDSSCVQWAELFCADFCIVPESAYVAIECDVPICGTLWKDRTTGDEDRDLFLFTVDAPISRMTVTVTSDFAPIIYFREAIDCGTYLKDLDFRQVGCELSLTACLEQGTYVIDLRGRGVR